MSPEKVSSFVWLIVGILIVYFSFKLDIGNLSRPGPGFLNFWSGLIFCFLSFLLFIRFKKSNSSKEYKSIGQIWENKNWKKTILVAVTIFLYAIVFTHVGFIISTFCLVLFLLRTIEPIKWKTAILGALLTSFLSFIIFDLLLQVQLPHNYLEILLFQTKRALF